MFCMYWISIFIGLKCVASSIDTNLTSSGPGKDEGSSGFMSNILDLVLGRRQMDLSQYLQTKTEKSKYDNGPKRGKNYDPSIGYEPYWADGDWVFKWFYDLLAQNQTSSFCDAKCSPIYTRYGKICGRNKYFNFQTFDEYCDMIKKECVDKQGWYIAYRGKCLPPLYLHTSPIPDYLQD